MVRRVLPAVIMAVVLAGLPVAWVFMSHASVATAAEAKDPKPPKGPKPTVTVVATTTVVQTVRATTTVVQTVRATTTVNRTATSHSVTTAMATVQQPGPTVVRTMPGGQVVHTAVASPAATNNTARPSSPSAGAIDAADRGLAVATSGPRVWPYVLGILVLVLAGVVGVLVSSRE